MQSIVTLTIATTIYAARLRLSTIDFSHCYDSMGPVWRYFRRTVRIRIG